MKILATFTDQDLGIQEASPNRESFRLREAARAVILTPENKVIVMQVKNHGFYKLPGGGFEHGESLEQALNREILEEAGAKIKVIEMIGAVHEYRDKPKLKQISYCFLARQVGELIESNFTEEEMNDGFVRQFLPLEKALNAVSKPILKKYGPRYMQLRDSLLLTQANKLIKNRPSLLAR